MYNFTSDQLQWAAISGAAALGTGLLIYDSLGSKVKKTEAANVKLRIEELWHYPIKGLGGIRIKVGKIGPQGFEHDRTFCLQKIHRDAETNEIKNWETMYSGFHLQMTLFKQILEEDDSGKTIIVTYVGPENDNPKQLEWTGSEHQIRIPLRPDVTTLEKIHLNLHGSETDAYDLGPSIQAYFTKYMDFECHLVYIGSNSRVVLGSGAPNGTTATAKPSPNLAGFRKLLPSFLFPPPETITFQDIGQYLVVTRESNAEVSSRLDGADMDISKFRANIIVSGAPAPYDEDYWHRILFPGNVDMQFGGTCWRCQAITVDYATGKKAEGGEGLVWKKLAKDRRVDKGWKYGPVFGKYAYTGRKDYGKVLREGEECVLTEKVRERPVFDWPVPKHLIAAFQVE